MTDKTKNILIRGVNWIGDAVMTMPAIRALRKAYPDSKISLFVKIGVAPLFEKDPNIDEIILYSDEFKGIRGKIKLSRIVRQKKFSQAILLQNAFDAALIPILSGIPERIGYSRDGRGFLLTNAIPIDKKILSLHHIDYYLNLLNSIGIETPYRKPWIYLALEERLWAKKQLNDLKRPIIGINPGATYGSAKRWIPERFAEVAYRIITELAGSIVLFGSPREAEISDEIVKNLKSMSPSSIPRYSLLLMAGKTNLRELASLISECDVFVTNDSGPMHLSYAVGTPLVAIFGSTDPNLTGPLNVKAQGSKLKVHDIVIKKDIECSPCFGRECRRGDLACMEAISADEVFDALKKLIPKHKAVFFDRDGTLCRDVGYLNKYDDFQIFAEIDNVELLKERGFKLIGVSNQSGIARGIVEEDFVNEINEIFIKRYNFDGFYYCPHHPDEHCPCRKPEPQMLLRARVEHGIDLKKSYVVGDKDDDMLLAKAVGAKGVLVLTGQHKESSYADFVAKDLKEVVDFIVRDSGNRWNYSL